MRRSEEHRHHHHHQDMYQTDETGDLEVSLSFSLPPSLSALFLISCFLFLVSCFLFLVSCFLSYVHMCMCARVCAVLCCLMCVCVPRVHVCVCAYCMRVRACACCHACSRLRPRPRPCPPAPAPAPMLPARARARSSVFTRTVLLGHLLIIASLAGHVRRQMDIMYCKQIQYCIICMSYLTLFNILNMLYLGTI